VKGSETSFYDLSPQEFEQLVARFLQSEGASSVDIVGGKDDQGVDISAIKDGKPVVVQVKHTRNVSPKTAREDIARILAGAYKPATILYVTSAEVSSAIRAEIEQPIGGVHIRLIDGQEISAALKQKPEIGSSTIAKAANRKWWQDASLIGGVLGAILSLGAFAVEALQTGLRFQNAPLNERIETVERAIGSLKDLEQNLTDIKTDMEDTRLAKAAIEADYEKARELEKLTDAQLDSIKLALSSQGWWQTSLNYVFGFILGVASSLVASVIYERWQQWRAINQVT
jgi:Holliday junction resolvase